MIPPHRVPPPPPKNHRQFYPDGLRAAFIPHRGGADLFFCRDLPPKSPQAKIMTAVARYDHGALRDLIARHPEVPPDFTNGNGLTPLMVAAARGNIEGIALLADHPLVALSTQSRDGWTALHYAAWSGQAETVALLLRRHADFTIENDSGETAFSLAANKETEAAFRAHKACARYLQRIAPPDDPAAAVPVDKAASDANSPDGNNPNGNNAETPHPAADVLPLSVLFLRAAFNLAPVTVAEGLWKHLKDDIDAHRNDALAEACDKITAAAQEAAARGQDIPFDWGGLLAAAAVAGNIPALTLIARKAPGLDSAAMTRVLAQVIRHGNNDPRQAEAVHHLLCRGADPNASGKDLRSPRGKAGTLAYHAFSRGQAEIFETICLYPGDLHSWHTSLEQLVWEQRVRRAIAAGEEGRGAPSAAASGGDTSTGIRILQARASLRRMNPQQLTAQLQKALSGDDAIAAMAAYAESRTARTTRPAFAPPPETIGKLLAVALRHGHTVFARRLVADTVPSHVFAAPKISGIPSPVQPKQNQKHTGHDGFSPR